MTAHNTESDYLFAEDMVPAVRKAAVLSAEPIPVYRYVLERWWCDPGAFLQRPATFVMLNPSTADADHDDPTIQRCMKFARSWGLDGIRVVNLYAWRATQPADMWAALANGEDIVGPQNEHEIRKALLRAYNTRTPVIAAWGNHGAEGRVEWLRQHVQRLAGTASGCGRGLVLSCLGTTLSGAPKHPLARGQHRIPDDQKLIQWWPSAGLTTPASTTPGEA